MILQNKMTETGLKSEVIDGVNRAKTKGDVIEVKI